MKKLFILIIAIIFAGIGFFSFFGHKSEDKDPVHVECIQVSRNHFVSSVSATGQIISRRIETVKSDIFGIVLDSGYQNRDFVKKGTAIAKIRLDERVRQQKQRQLKLVEIDLQILKEQREQAEELFEAKAISERELKELKIREYKQQVAMINAQEELADKEMIASFDGMIVQKKFKHQYRVYNSAELFTLVDMQDICVEIEIFQSDISTVYIGQKVIITNDIFKEALIGKISEISSTASQFGSQNRSQNAAVTFKAYADFNCSSKDQLLFGSQINADIVLEEKDDVLNIPLESILYRGDKKIVFVIQEGLARERVVETGGYNDRSIEIVSGLSEGEMLITKGNLDVEEGKGVIIGKKHPIKQSSSLLPYLR